MNANIQIPALEKLIDYTASGIGSVAGPMLATWRARREAEALRISTQGEADSMRIIAEAQADARSLLVSSDSTMSGELNLAQTVNQRIQFQEEKRQRNIASVVRQAADELGDKEVPDSDTDHDWSSRFFGDVQDVSSVELQQLWAKVLAGAIERPGSTSLRTLGILRNLNRTTAEFFLKLAPLCVTVQDAVFPHSGVECSTIILSFDTTFGSGTYRQQPEFGIEYQSLNLLIEHGLIQDDYNLALWFNTPALISDVRKAIIRHLPITVRYQNEHWLLSEGEDGLKALFLPCIALTRPGVELLQVLEVEPDLEHSAKLNAFLEGSGLSMTRLESPPLEYAL